MAAGSLFNQQGGGSNYLCLTDQPLFLQIQQGSQQIRGPIVGVEYEDGTFGFPRDFNVPCVACHNTMRASKIMIPGTTACPNSWTIEYFGYLVSETNAFNDHYRTTFECVDVDAEGIPGSSDLVNDAFFYFTEAACNGNNCIPYENGAEITCVVCTK